MTSCVFFVCCGRTGTEQTRSVFVHSILWQPSVLTTDHWSVWPLLPSLERCMFAINRHAPILDCGLTLTIHSGLATSPRRGLPAWSLGCRGHRHVTRGGQQSRHGLYRRRASQRSTPPSICCKQSGVINFPLSTLPNCCFCNKSTTTATSP